MRQLNLLLPELFQSAMKVYVFDGVSSEEHSSESASEEDERGEARRVFGVVTDAARRRFGEAPTVSLFPGS